MSLTMLIVLLIILCLVLIGGLIFFGISSARNAKARHQLLYDLVDGRMTELITMHKTAAELLGRAAERTDQIMRERQEKERLDEQRHIQTVEQADRFMTEQEKPVPKDKL